MKSTLKRMNNHSESAEKAFVAHVARIQEVINRMQQDLNDVIDSTDPDNITWRTVSELGYLNGFVSDYRAE